MRRYATLYGVWLLGVLTAAAIALYYYRRLLALGDEALQGELARRPRPSGPTPSPPVVEDLESEAENVLEHGFEDTESIEDARPPTLEYGRVRRSRGATD